jgi:hypothetical protein
MQKSQTWLYPIYRLYHGLLENIKDHIHVHCLIVCFWSNNPQWARVSSFMRFLYHTQLRTTVGRTPLGERSARRRDLYLTKHNTHDRQTSMTPVGFEPTNTAGKRPQIYAFERVANGTGTCMSLHLWIQSQTTLVFLSTQGFNNCPNTTVNCAEKYTERPEIYWKHHVKSRRNVKRDRRTHDRPTLHMSKWTEYHTLIKVTITHTSHKVKKE